MSIVQSLLTTIITIFLFAILPIVVFTMVTGQNGSLFGIRSFVVLTGSMTPAIPVGSLVYTVPAATYQTGDIISFTKGDVTVTHRIVEVVEGDGGMAYRTQGDANNTPDTALVLGGDVIGKEIIQFPWIGTVISWLRTVPGFLIGIIMPGVMVILLELWKIKQEIEKATEKRLLEKMHPPL